MDREEIRRTIRDVPDFPKPGIIFKDLSPLMKDARIFKGIIEELAALHSAEKPDYILGVEARGFIFGSAMAMALGCGFLPIRKKGKLPGETVSINYALEYGRATIEMLKGSLSPGDKVVIFDDLLATGGTMAASASLAKGFGVSIISADFVVELAFLKGRSKVKECPVNSLVVYE